MVTFDSITDRVSAFWPFFTHTCPLDGITRTWGPRTEDPPVSQTFSYEPIVIEEFRTPPDATYQRAFPPRDKSIWMSDYSASSRRTENLIVHRKRELKDWVRFAIWTSGGTCCYGPDLQARTWSWTENYSLEQLSNVTTSVFQDKFSIDPDDLNRAIAITQTQALADASAGVDILTELAEAGKTLDFFANGVIEIASLIDGLRGKDPETFRRGYRQHANSLRRLGKPFKRLAAGWLQLQYAILPIIYLFREVNNELGSKDAVFLTSRSKRSLNLTEGQPPEEIPERTLFHTAREEVVVKTTVKSSYPAGRLQRLLDRAAFNPFSTAWELIPLSFVVDWVFNVGDTIRSKTSIDLSTERKMCTSVKSTRVQKIHYLDNGKDVSSNGGASNPCAPAFSESHEFQRSNADLVQTVTTEDYRRSLVTRTSWLPSFDPYLSWQRIVTAAALTVAPTMKLLGSMDKPYYPSRGPNVFPS